MENRCGMYQNLFSVSFVQKFIKRRFSVAMKFKFVQTKSQFEFFFLQRLLFPLHVPMEFFAGLVISLEAIYLSSRPSSNRHIFFTSDCIMEKIGKRILLVSSFFSNTSNESFSNIFQVLAQTLPYFQGFSISILHNIHT